MTLLQQQCDATNNNAHFWHPWQLACPLPVAIVNRERRLCTVFYFFAGLFLWFYTRRDDVGSLYKSAQIGSPVAALKNIL